MSYVFLVTYDRTQPCTWHVRTLYMYSPWPIIDITTYVTCLCVSYLTTVCVVLDNCLWRTWQLCVPYLISPWHVIHDPYVTSQLTRHFYLKYWSLIGLIIFHCSVMCKMFLKFYSSSVSSKKYRIPKMNMKLW